jgi:hypothetical protein
MTETWEPIGTTLTPQSRLLSVLDTPEGFRVLIEDHSGFVYAVRAEAVFYRRCNLLYDGEYTDSSPPSLAKQKTILFRVHNSTLLAELSRTASAFGCKPHGPLQHFALCFENEDRIDIVCDGDVRVRAAYRRQGDHDS